MPSPVFCGSDGCWDHLGWFKTNPGVDSAQMAAAECRKVFFLWGKAGRPGSERLMRLPCRMYPLGKRGLLWPGSGLGCRIKKQFQASLEGQVLQRDLPPQRAMQRDVDLIAYGQLSPQPTLWEIRRVLAKALFGRCGRSSVVFTEGVDLGPLDRGRAPEACEIGGLGTLSCGACGAERSGGRCPAVLRRRYDFLIGR
jgi:hypothetical protein